MLVPNIIAGPISEMAIAVEIFQIAYVAIMSIILVKERRE
jgi:hypothetical protein